MSTPNLRVLSVHDDSAQDAVATIEPEFAAPGSRRIDPVTGFWQTYAETTGWQLSESSRMTKTSDRPDIEPSTESDVPRGGKMLSATGAARLADAASKLAGHLNDQQSQINAYHAGLAIDEAASIDQARPVTARRIDEILANTTEASGCTAAHVDLLDETTENLTTRFVFGLAPTGRLGRVRPLRGARGDLEAMVGGLVTFENRAACPIDVDAAPEDFESSLCVALGSDDLPIGTMWLHSDRPTEFNDGQTAAARIGAQLIAEMLAAQPDAAPLPTAVALSIASEDAEPTLADEIADWQTATAPVGTCLARGWNVASGGRTAAAIDDHWTHWDVLPDGTLAVAVARCNLTGGDCDTGLLMNTALSRSALLAHAGYRHRPADALMRVNDTLLQIDPMASSASADMLLDRGQRPARGPSGVAMVYAHVDPTDGRTRIASVGPWEMLVRSERGYRPIPGPPSGDGLGSDVELQCYRGETTLQPGETLVIVGVDASPATPTLASRVAGALDGSIELSKAIESQLGTEAGWAGLQISREETTQPIQRRAK